jgi:hypothetical protein
MHRDKQGGELYPHESVVENGPGVCEERRHAGQVLGFVEQDLATVSG